jgi:hypothetical protein
VWTSPVDRDGNDSKEDLGGLPLTDDGLRRIAIDRERVWTFVEADASRCVLVRAAPVPTVQRNVS